MFQRKVTLGGLVALVAVAACQAPTTTKPATGSDDSGGGGKISARRTPTPAPSKDANAATPTPTSTPIRVTAPPTPKPTPTPAKTPVPPGVIDFKSLTGNPNPNGKTTLTGAVYNNAGVKFEKDAKIIYKLDGGQEQQVTIEGGKYVLPDLAPGSYHITATEYGSTPRTQYVSLIKGVDYTLNFGEPNTDTQVYALYDKPEITKVEPNQFKNDLKTDALSFRISLSEPATNASIRALVDTLRLAPMNKAAAGNDTDPPVIGPKSPAEDGPTDVDISKFPWSIKFFDFMDYEPAPPPDESKPTKFFDALVTYSVELDQFINISFAAPIFNAKTAPEYQLFVVADPAHKVMDLDNKPLGTDKTGGLDTNPATAGQILNNVFLSPYLGPDTFKKETPESQWDSTHTNAIPLKFLPDTAPPGVVAVSVVADNKPKVDGVEEFLDGTHIKVEFNEPIAVIGPGGTAIRQPVLDINNYSFIVGINTEYLGGTTLLDGVVAPTQELTWDTKNFGTGGEEFKLKADEHIKVEVIAPKAVRIYLPNFEFLDKEKAKAFSVRVAGIEDPAGNVLPAAQADKREAQPRATVDFSRIVVPSPAP